MTTEVRRCVLYARLSVSKEESVSIDRQLDSARKYADGRGWEVVGEFVDDGVSATANRPEDRKGWSALLRAGQFEAVVIWKVDRLARRVLDFLHVDEVLRARGAGLVAVEDPIDMTSPMGRAFATILAVFGEMEAAAISSRIRAARAHLLKEGRFVGGGIPYGYRSIENPDGPGRVLEKDPDRIGWVAEMIRLAQQGLTVNGIAKWLDEQEAPLPRRKTEADTWNRQTVIGLLRNPILAGMIARNPGRKRSASGAGIDPFAVVRDDTGAPVVDESLAVITVEDFRTLVDTLDARTAAQARPFAERQRTSPFLSKVARCDEDGRYLCRGTNQKRPVLYCPACRQTIGRTALDAYLIDRLLDERADEKVNGLAVGEAWARAGHDDLARRAVLVSQLDMLVIRRGVVGRYFDEERVLLTWKQSSEVAQ